MLTEKQLKSLRNRMFNVGKEKLIDSLENAMINANLQEKPKLAARFELSIQYVRKHSGWITDNG